MPAGSASKARAAAAFRPSTSMMSSDGAPRAKEISCSAVMPYSLRAASLRFSAASAPSYPAQGMATLTPKRSHFMIGLVLAAGAGRRLGPYTHPLPKALVPVDGDTTIMDISLRNLAAAGLSDVTIVVGYCAGAVEERKDAFEAKDGVQITLVQH